MEVFYGWVGVFVVGGGIYCGNFYGWVEVGGGIIWMNQGGWTLFMGAWGEVQANGSIG